MGLAEIKAAAAFLSPPAKIPSLFNTAGPQKMLSGFRWAALAKQAAGQLGKIAKIRRFSIGPSGSLHARQHLRALEAPRLGQQPEILGQQRGGHDPAALEQVVILQHRFRQAVGGHGALIH